MLLTEEEAKTKACCKAMEWYQGKIMTAPCIASECMAWRWYDDLDEQGKVRLYKERGQSWSTYEIVDDLSMRRGHCGLAGRP